MDEEVKANSLVYLVLSLALLAGGCGRNDPTDAKTVIGGKGLSYEELSDSDVVVKVGARALTKRALEDEVELFCSLRALDGRKQNETEAMKRCLRDRERRRIFKGFPTKVLLLDAAKDMGLRVSREAISNSEAIVSKPFVRRAYPHYAELKSAVGVEQGKMLDRIVLQDALIRTALALHAEGKLDVSEAEIDEVIDQVTELNKVAEAELAKSRAKAADIKRRLLAKENFSRLADQFSATIKEDGAAGVWGDFIVKEIPYPEIAKAVADKNPWEWVGPFELDDAIHFVRVLSRIRRGKENGSEDEVKLARIVVALPMFYKAGTRDEIRRDTRNRKFDDLQAKWLKELREKAVVAYPSGTNLWAVVRKPKSEKFAQLMQEKGFTNKTERAVK